MPPVRYAITAIAATIVVVLPIILTRIRAGARKIRQVAEAMGPCVIPADRHTLRSATLNVRQHAVITHRTAGIEIREKCEVRSLLWISQRQLPARRQIGQRGALPS